MSADSTRACPACYARANDIPIEEITQRDHLNHVIDGDDHLKEFWEHYIYKGTVVFEYHGAQCEACGYRIPAFTLTHPIPGLKPVP